MSSSDWMNIRNKLGLSFVIIGDLNCLHPMWNCNQANKKGKEILTFIKQTHLYVVNVNHYTHINKPGGHNNNLDLALTSPNLATKIDYHIMKDPMSSDHLPLLIQLELPVGRKPKVRNPLQFNRN